MRKFLLYLLALLPLSVSAYQLNRVSVHDPSVVWEPSSKTYYIFGSHRAVAKTTDMMDWSLVNLGKEGGMGDLVGVPWRTGSSENAISSIAFLLPEVTKVKKGGAEVDMPSFI